MSTGKGSSNATSEETKGLLGSVLIKCGKNTPTRFNVMNSGVGFQLERNNQGCDYCGKSHHINKVQDRNKLENGGEVVIIGRKRKGRPAGTTTWSDFRLKVEQV
jgi:hypothetical protein